jgi:hypothetical protein
MQGYIYPNEFELRWSLLIVLYPYLTGLVAGAFILASLARVFNVKEVEPTYRLALLTALAFLIVAPLPLLAHLGHPERSYEIFLTPNRQSAMAMFGFVYAWITRSRSAQPICRTGPWDSTTRPAAGSPSSASRQPSCCTDTWASSSDP